MYHTNWKIGFAMLAMGLVTSAHANFLSNADFELGGGPATPPSGWLSSGVVGVTNDTPDFSLQSMSVNSTSGGTSSEGHQVASISNGVLFEKAVQLSFSYKGDRPYWTLVALDGADAFISVISADAPPASAGWADYTSPSFAVPSGTENVRVLLYDLNDNGLPVFFDNVVLIPEPNSSLLLGLGVLGLGWMRRHRQKVG